MKQPFPALIVVAMLTLSACGGGGGDGLSAEETKAAGNISDFLVNQQQGEDVVSVPRKDADCISEGMVGDIGVDSLEKYGFLKKDGTVAGGLESMKMSTEDAESMTDTMFSCTDVTGMMKESMTTQMGSQDPALKKCIDEVLTEGRTREMMTAVFSGDTAAAGEALTTPMMKCAREAQGG